MDTPRRSQHGGSKKDRGAEGTKAKVTKSCGRESQEKPALSTIEEETDSPDSSGDSAINFRGHELPEASAKNYPYDLRVSLREDYEEVLRDLRDGGDEEEGQEEGRQPADSPPFLTARNGSDHEAGSKSGDSNSTASYEKSSPDDDDDEEEENEDVSSFPGESSSGDADYRCDDDDEVDDLERDLEEQPVVESQAESSKRMKASRKSAPSAVVIESSLPNREERLHELTTSVEWLKARLVRTEKDVRSLKKQLSLEKSRNRKFVRSYDEDRDVTKESLRIDLELWIKKLNDGLKVYLAEWQQRERLRINEEISRISDLYSQEIARSLKTSLKDWQTDDAKKLLELMDKRDRMRRDKERGTANAIYERIQSHLENLEKRNRKSYASFRRQIDKWEDRLRNELVKLREEDLKKLREQVDMWHEEERKKSPSPSPRKAKTNSKDSCTEKEGCCSFPGSEALLHVEENLLKRLRDSSSKDLRRTEQIVRTELKAQRRELAKRMNEKIAELWMAFEEFGFAPGGVVADRARPRRRLSSSGAAAAAAAHAAVGRNDLDDCRAIIAGSFTKDTMLLNPDVFGGRWTGGKIVVRDIRADGSTRSSTDDVEDGDRDYKEDDDDDDDDDDAAAESHLEDKSEIPNQQSATPGEEPTLLDSGSPNAPNPREAEASTFDAAEDLSREIATRK